jgi:hypothetical protein
VAADDDTGGGLPPLEGAQDQPQDGQQVPRLLPDGEASLTNDRGVVEVAKPGLPLHPDEPVETQGRCSSSMIASRTTGGPRPRSTAVNAVPW